MLSDRQKWFYKGYLSALKVASNIPKYKYQIINDIIKHTNSLTPIYRTLGVYFVDKSVEKMLVSPNLGSLFRGYLSRGTGLKGIFTNRWVGYAQVMSGH